MLTVTQGAWRKVASKREGNETTIPADGKYNLGGPCVRGVTKPGSGRIRKVPQPEELVNGCAKQLESLNQVALDQIRDGSPNGLVVEYRQLPEVRVLNLLYLRIVYLSTCSF